MCISRNFTHVWRKVYISFLESGLVILDFIYFLINCIRKLWVIEFCQNVGVKAFWNPHHGQNGNYSENLNFATLIKSRNAIWESDGGHPKWVVQIAVTFFANLKIIYSIIAQRIIQNQNVQWNYLFSSIWRKKNLLLNRRINLTSLFFFITRSFLRT